ncbi:MAG: DnaJ C-terminal domain-containing protein [Pseudomonadota bacterium]
MAKDPYTMLGVGRQASQDDIRSAYRKLAKQYHPDRNPGDAAAEDKFKAATAAFEIIGDEAKRKRFDRGEIDAEGNDRGAFGQGGPFAGVDPAEAARRFQERAQRGRQSRSFEDFGDVFSDFFGRGESMGRQHRQPEKGRDIRTRLTVPFLEAAQGAKKRVTLPQGDTVDVTIPEGLRDGQTLRLRGKGQQGTRGGQPGDLFVEVSVTPHPDFELQGDHVLTEAPLPLKTAVLGGKLSVATLSGRATIKIPANTSSGVIFRLKSKGLKQSKSGTYSDFLVKVRIKLPAALDADLEAFMRSWAGDDEDQDAAGMAEAQ